MKKIIKFHSKDIEVEFHPITRKDRKALATIGIFLPDFGAENFSKLSDYLLEHCLISELSDDTPIGVDLLITNAIIEASYSPNGDEAKN